MINITIMKPVFILFLFLSVQLPLQAQHNVAGKYGLDTTLIPCASCKPGKVYEYFSIHGKYPESAMSLQQRVNAQLKEAGIPLEKNGFITFRFTVNNEGRTSAYRLYTLDTQYRQQEYSRALVAGLYSFVQALKQWKTNLNHPSGPVYYYNYYLSFQIKNGKIISVAP